MCNKFWEKYENGLRCLLNNYFSFSHQYFCLNFWQSSEFSSHHCMFQHSFVVLTSSIAAKGMRNICTLKHESVSFKTVIIVQHALPVTEMVIAAANGAPIILLYGFLVMQSRLKQKTIQVQNISQLLAKIENSLQI